MRIIFGLVLAILLSSCTTTTNNYYPKTVETWRGGHIRDLVKRWGPPSSKVVYTHGEAIYIYKTEGYSAGTAQAAPEVGVHVAGGRPTIITTSSLNNGANRGVSLHCVTVFMVNKAGIITETKTQGSGCYGGESFAAKMGR